MTVSYLKGGAFQLVGGVIRKSEKKHYSKRGRPKKESPILERKFYVYADNPEMAERWKSTADNAGVPISKYFRELIEEHTVTEETEISNQIERLTKPLHDSKSEIQNINNEKFLNDNTSRNILEYEQKLKMNPKEKEKLRNIANSVQDGIIMTDDFGKISFWNQSDERIFGYMNNTVLGKQFVDIIFPEDTKDEMAQRFISLGKTEDGLLLGETVEVVAKRKDGSIFPIELSFSRLKINDEWHSLYIVRDNTKRKEAETKVREIKDSYDRITDNADEIIFRVEAEGGHVIYANPAAERLLGYSKDELLTDPNLGFKIIHPDYAEKQKKIIEEINAKKNPIKNVVLGWICKDGREIIVEYTVIPVLDEVGKIIYFESIGRDITERKKVEDALKESEERYRILYEKSADGILIADVETKRFLFANPAICTMLQYSEEELIRMSVGDIHPKESLSHVFAEFEAQAKQKKTLAENIPCLCKDERILYADVNTTSMFIDGRKYNIGLFRDITKRKKAEQAVIRTKEYLKNIINSAPQIIIAFNTKGKVTTWNKTAELLTGYKQREVIGRDINKLDLFDNPQELLDNIKNIYDRNEFKWDELVLRTKNDTNRIIRVSHSIIKGEQEQDTDVLIIGENITDERKEHGKLLRGNSYLICDKNNRSALHLFSYLTRSNYNGLYATRTNPSNIDNLIDLTNNQAILFSQDKLREFEHISNLDELTVAIKEFIIKHTNSVILLDRIDYFLNRFSFEQFIDSLYKINDIVRNNKAILLMYLNPSFIEPNQLSMIEEELHQLPGHKINSVLIGDELYDILKFVYEQNQKNSMVFFKKISRELLVDKKTVAKRLKILTDKGLVSIKKQGRLKTVYLSEKGKVLFYERHVA